MAINVQLSHSHNSSLPLRFNKGEGANTSIQLTEPHQYGKEVLKSHTNFHIVIMCSVKFIESSQISIITGVGFFLGFYLFFLCY